MTSKSRMVIDMTLDEIRTSDKTVLTPADVADVLRADPQDVRVAAKQHPERLGFNVIIIGSRIKIPKYSFLKSLGIDD